jgi:hypothetical protein
MSRERIQKTENTDINPSIYKVIANKARREKTKGIIDDQQFRNTSPRAVIRERQ